MNYWLFTVTQKKRNGEILEAEDIFRQRQKDEFWGLGEKTPNRRNLRRGDRVVFYVGWPLMIFAGTATLDSDYFSLSEEEKDRYSQGDEFYRSDYGVRLTNIEVFEDQRFVKELVPSLKFIENKENWNTYFQGGIRQLSEDDFLTIIGGRIITSAEFYRSEDGVVSESQFALEAHLEEFIDKNWDFIDFGEQLKRYVTDEQSGRQFPAGTWSIDFLCVGPDGEFVVLELKRGRTSDSVVGQVLRYIGWVDENLVTSGKKTRGVIIAKDVDDALRYAIKSIPQVSLLTYKVDFELVPFG